VLIDSSERQYRLYKARCVVAMVFCHPIVGGDITVSFRD